MGWSMVIDLLRTGGIVFDDRWIGLVGLRIALVFVPMGSSGGIMFLGLR